jgi:hypothetical protein
VNKVPNLERRFICIADREAFTLAAVTSSYLFTKDTYLPLFSFPSVNAPKIEGDDLPTEAQLSNHLGNNAAVLINNAWARMQGSEYVILVGLSAHQRSFLLLPNRVNVIEITELKDIQEKLSILSPPNQPELTCQTADVLTGLFIAEKEGRRLVVDESSERLGARHMTKGGLIVVENSADVASVVAVNYANSVASNLLVVPPIGKREVKVIHRYIQDWKELGDSAAFVKIQDAIRSRLDGTSSLGKDYATFFTNGLPYSLVIENAVPCSYVHLSVRPDLFILNSILSETTSTHHSAVVFSPLFFLDEETEWLIKFFTDHKFYLKQLTGQNATFANFDFAVQHFPYSVLHICSHGGEVEGWEASQEFVDRNGAKHVIEYDEVLGFDPVPDKDQRIRVHRKLIFRRLDGFAWMSDELDAKKIPAFVLEDMWSALYGRQENEATENVKRRNKGRIATSCAIRCVDNIHQGEFNILASHSSPIIFNNTCWSWYEVALFFLSCGARGYIGTLWDVDNSAAVIAAKTFYDRLSSSTVVVAFHEAVRAIAGTRSKDIYVYWGLHFTTLSAANCYEQSRFEVFRELISAIGGWSEQIEENKSLEIKKQAGGVLKLVLHELNTNFGPQDLKRLEIEVAKRRTTPSGSHPGDSKREFPIGIRPSMEYPTEYRQAEEQERGD